MIARWIDWCARNRFLVFTGTLLLVLAGIWSMQPHPARCAAGHLRRAGDHPYRLDGEPPNIIEDQVTYPIVTAMLAAPHVKAVRAQTMFGDSYVFVVFEDGTDLYWARSRVLEYLQQIQGRLPAGVHPDDRPRRNRRRAGSTNTLIVDRNHRYSLADLRSLQDWYPPLPARNRAGSRGSRHHRRLRPAVPGQARPEQAARVQHSALNRDRPGSRQHQRSRRPGA